MSLGTTCTVCQHPQVATVNDWLFNRSTSRSSVSKRFDLTLDALRRHVDNEHAERVQGIGGSAEDAPAIPAGASPREKLKIVSDWLEKRFATGQIRVDEMREYRLAQKDIAEMDSAEAPSTVDISAVEGLQDLLALVAEVLEPYPEARQRLVAEIKKRKLPW